jgi:hypothetical protein
MTAQRPSRLALAVLDRFVASEPLKGDLIEQFERRQSQWWLWRQVIGAVTGSPRLDPYHSFQGGGMLIVGAAVLMLMSFEAVFVMNLIYRLTFGPPMPDISGYFYAWQQGMFDMSRGVVVPLYAWTDVAILGITVAASIPIAWVIARLHQQHYTLSLGLFIVSVALCAALNLQWPFAVQFVTMVIFIAGLLAAGRRFSTRAPRSA